MADRNAQSSNDEERELVFCHVCEEEWFRNEHGLICPSCSSDIVEIIESDSDPRAEREAPPIPQYSHPTHPLHDHNPWRRDTEDAPDPEEDDVGNLSWSSPGGRMSYHSVTYTSGPGGGFTTVRRGNGMGTDPFASIFSNLMGMQGPMLGGPPNPGHRHIHDHGRHGDQSRRSPLQEGPRMEGMAGSPSRVGGGFTLTTDFGHGRETHNVAMEDIHGILSNLLGARPPHGGPGTEGRGIPLQGGPLDLLTQLFNPANAQHGNAVYSNEAMDRIMSQLMEQHGGSTAPGPAAEAAINALPKIKITKDLQDNNGIAECSICMEAIPLDEEVTQLPCKHWFHADCVSAWLREHDTCPQCRRGITPKEGDGQTPRATGEAPRNWQFPEGLSRTNSEGMPGSGTASSPFQVPSSPEPGPSSPSRNRGSGGVVSGITGWMGRFAGRRDNNTEQGSGPEAGNGGNPNPDNGQNHHY